MPPEPKCHRNARQPPPLPLPLPPSALFTLSLTQIHVVLGDNPVRHALMSVGFDGSVRNGKHPEVRCSRATLSFYMHTSAFFSCSPCFWIFLFGVSYASLAEGGGASLPLPCSALKSIQERITCVASCSLTEKMCEKEDASMCEPSTVA